MLVVIGTYRKKLYVERALESIDKYVTGVTGVAFVDDSGDENHSAWLRTQGDEVWEIGRLGYNAAMKAVCDLGATVDRFMFWEEDFVATAPIDLNRMAEVLDERPYLGQLALLRQPWFPVEHEHGGLIEALVAKGHSIEEQDGIIEQQATFTGNPSVWQRGIAAKGWPGGQWSEDAMRDVLISEGYKFGYLPGIRVHHDGKRQGYGY